MQINVGFLTLLYTVRRQIFLKVADLKSRAWSSEIPTDTIMSEKSGSIAPTASRSAGRPSISRSIVRDMASSTGLANATQQARDLQGLQKAEMDLAVVACSVIMLSVGGLGVCLQIAILNGKRMYFTQVGLCSTMTSPTKLTRAI